MKVDEGPVKEVKASIAEKSLHRLFESKRESDFQEVLYFVDSGGQSQFQEVLQAFIPNAHVLLLVLKLTEKLSDFPIMEYATAQSSYTLGRYAISNEEIITRSARMVHSTSESAVEVALVGTYHDLYSKTEHETLEEKNSRLLRVFSFCKDRLLHYNLANGSLLFPVNGLQAEEGKFDDPIVCQLRSAIGSALEHVPMVDVPLRYYALELTLQKHAASTGENVLSLVQCRKMSNSLRFPVEDVPLASGISLQVQPHCLLFHTSA